MLSYELNTAELYSFLSYNETTSPYLGAVCAADQLPPLHIQNPKLFIVNTQTSDLPGSHWVCFFLSEKGPPEFFDSLGQTPQYYQENFENFLVNHGYNYLINSCPVQSPNSTACGYFCLFYAYLRCRGYSFENIMSKFSVLHLENNTDLVIKYVNYYYI